MTREADPPDVDMTSLRVVNTDHSFTEQEVETMKVMIRNYNNAKWAFALMISLGSIITGIIYWFIEHFNVVPKG